LITLKQITACFINVVIYYNTYIH